MSNSSKKDLFEELGLYDKNSDDSVIPLAMGAPGVDTMRGCKDILLESTKITLEEDERYIFQYGPMKGDPDFLEKLASFLSSQYGNEVNSNELMVTAGATQGLHLTASVMFDKESPVFVEDPTHYIAIKLLRDDLKMNVIAIPTDNDGIIPEELEKAIKINVKKEKVTNTPFKAMVYLMTTFSNPRGCSSSPERCRQLVHLARKHEILLFTDDVYNLLYYTDTCPPRLMYYDEKSDPDFTGGNVLSNGSFSKILAPGLRLGWIEAPRRIIQFIGESNTALSGGCFNHYTSRLMTTAIKHGMLSKHLSSVRNIYKERMKTICNLLSQEISVPIKFIRPEGGLFVWVELPSSYDSKRLLQIATEKYGVNFIIGSRTSPSESFKYCIRLSIGFCEVDKLQEGIARLKEAILEYQSV